MITKPWIEYRMYCYWQPKLSDSPVFGEVNFAGHRIFFRFV